MSQFPQFSKPYPKLLQKIKGRAGSSALWNTTDNVKNSVGVNGLTPWIRVISAVSAHEGFDRDPIESGIQKGKEKGLILQSNYPEDGFNIRYGGTKNQPSGVVGFNLELKPVTVSKTRKLRPSPIITNLNIDEVDIGRKKTTFDIICYSLEHMEEVAKYFMNPGFAVLVEWGWNTQQARKAWCGYESTTGGTARGKVSIEDIVAYNNYRTIKKKREDANYDYDATLGYITDGAIEFGDNETYKLSVTLSSLGEIPEYMQNHKTAKKEGDVTTPTFDDDVEDEELPTPEGENELEISFNYMKKDLPYGRKKVAFGGGISFNKKQQPFEKLGSIKPKESDNGYHDVSNYINFNEKRIEQLNQLKEWLIKLEKDDTEVIDVNNPYIGNERFIRFELAVEILNSNVYDLDGKNDGKNSLVINIQDSFIGGFPNMFSTDSSKLFIPNTKHPNFSIDKLLWNTEGEEVENILEWYTEDKTYGTITYARAGEIKASFTKNMCPRPDGSITYKQGSTRQQNGSNTPHAFPSTYALNTEKIDDYKEWYNLDNTMQTVKCDKGYWGWLKNLYINYDFFLDTLVKPNLFTKDILYELLNGMSNACGNQWKFQVVENPVMNGTGPTELRIIDEYFTGLADLNITDNIFQLRGTKSPFLSADFKTELSKMQQNSIIQKRLANDATFKTGDDGGYNNTLNTSVFGVGLTDMVLNTISPTKKNINKKEEDAEAQEDTKTLNKRNKEFFLKKGTLVMKNKLDDFNSIVKTGKKKEISALANFFKNSTLITSWDDSDLLNQVRINAYSKKNEENLNIPYGLAVVSFKVHGISGFKRGDYIQYEGLPKNLETNCVYQVHEISHEIGNDGWFTNIVTKMRPYKFPTK